MNVGPHVSHMLLVAFQLHLVPAVVSGVRERTLMSPAIICIRLILAMAYLLSLQRFHNLEDRKPRRAKEGLRLAYSLLPSASIEARSFLESGYCSLDTGVWIAKPGPLSSPALGSPARGENELPVPCPAP